MEGDFYRRAPKRRWFRSTLKKIFKTRRRAVITILSIVLVPYILFDNKGIVSRIRLEMKRAEMVEKIRRAEEETKQLQEQIKALQSDKKTIEKIAREKYGMVREGETVYRVRKD